MCNSNVEKEVKSTSTKLTQAWGHVPIFFSQADNETPRTERSNSASRGGKGIGGGGGMGMMEEMARKLAARFVSRQTPCLSGNFQNHGKPTGHFQVHVCLLFKACLCAKFFL